MRAAVFNGVHPETGEQLEVVDEAPEGVPPFDLPAQEVRQADGELVAPFEIDEFRKYCMVNGLDEIGLTLRHADKIKAYEARRFAAEPWLARR